MRGEKEKGGKILCTCVCVHVCMCVRVRGRNDQREELAREKEERGTFMYVTKAYKCTSWIQESQEEGGRQQWHLSHSQEG